MIAELRALLRIFFALVWALASIAWTRLRDALNRDRNAVKKSDADRKDDDDDSTGPFHPHW